MSTRATFQSLLHDIILRPNAHETRKIERGEQRKSMEKEKGLSDSFAGLQVEDKEGKPRASRATPPKSILREIHEAIEGLPDNQIGVHAVRRPQRTSTRDKIHHFNDLLHDKLHSAKQEKGLDDIIARSKAESGEQELK